MFRNVSIFGRGFYQNISYFKSLMAVDRGGDKEDYSSPAQNLLPIFLECDGISYLRYASFFENQ